MTRCEAEGTAFNGDVGEVGEPGCSGVEDAAQRVSATLDESCEGGIRVDLVEHTLVCRGDGGTTDAEEAKEDRFSLAAPGDVKLEIYDIIGRQVRVFDKGKIDIGHHQIAWDGLNTAGDQVA